MKKYILFGSFLLSSLFGFAQNNFPTSGNVGINLGGTTSSNRLQIGPNVGTWNNNDLVISNTNGGLAIHTQENETYLYGSKDISIRPGWGKYAIYAKSNSYVGIGTINPQARLHVNPVRPILMKENGDNGVYGSEIGFNALLNTSAVPNQFRKLGGTSQSGGASMAVDYHGNILFQMFDGNTESEVITTYSPQIVFLNSGRVGIGTTSPDAKLVVKGTIHTQEVKVDLSGSVAPDYVFEKDYALTSLEELKYYIDQHKHLREIPSALEMEKEGINLKEMNLLLLKKVEELTLHVISQSEIINAQQTELIEVKSRLDQLFETNNPKDK